MGSENPKMARFGRKRVAGMDGEGWAGIPLTETAFERGPECLWQQAQSSSGHKEGEGESQSVQSSPVMPPCQEIPWLVREIP